MKYVYYQNIVSTEVDPQIDARPTIVLAFATEHEPIWFPEGAGVYLPGPDGFFDDAVVRYCLFDVAKQEMSVYLVEEECYSLDAFKKHADKLEEFLEHGWARVWPAKEVL